MIAIVINPEALDPEVQAAIDRASGSPSYVDEDTLWIADEDERWFREHPGGWRDVEEEVQ
jgi:hypothetical protein